MFPMPLRNSVNQKGDYAAPHTPTHCLKTLNENMRTDILKNVHFNMHDQMDAKKQQSPLVMLIKSITQVLDTHQNDGYSLHHIERNPLNIKPLFPFNREEDYQHDLALLKCQLKGLKQIRSEIGRY